jgi:hypothetical protein
MPLSTIFQSYHGSQFYIGGKKQSTWRKPQTCHKSLTTLSHNVVLSILFLFFILQHAIISFLYENIKFGKLFLCCHIILFYHSTVQPIENKIKILINQVLMSDVAAELYLLGSFFFWFVTVFVIFLHQYLLLFFALHFVDNLYHWVTFL